MNAQEIREQEVGDVRVVMSTLPGRRFIWRLLSMAGVYDTPLRGPFDVLEPVERLLYNVGQADFGRVILTDALAGDLVQYQMMQRESMERAMNEKANQKKESDNAE